MTPKQLPDPSLGPAQVAVDRPPGARGRAARPGSQGQPRPLGPAGGAPAGPAGRTPRRTVRDGIGTEDARLLDLARQFAAAYLEIEAGRRDPRQLVAVGWARNPARAAATNNTTTTPGRVVSVVGARTLPGRFDAVALVRRGHRLGAIAIHLARQERSWVVRDARCPEDVMDSVRSDRGLMAARPGLR